MAKTGTQPSQDKKPSTPEPPRGRARVRFAVMAVVYLLWIGFLAALVITTANPVVVSRLYAKRCRAVVRLEILPPTPDLPAGQPMRRCRVIAVYKGRVSDPEILVTRIPAGQRQTGRTAVALLNPVPGTPIYDLQPIAHGRYDAIKDRYAPGPPRLYPDTPSVLSQLEGMFGSPSPPPAARTQPTTRPATQPG